MNEWERWTKKILRFALFMAAMLCTFYTDELVKDEPGKRAMWFGIMCLLAMVGARAWHTDQTDEP